MEVRVADCRSQGARVRARKRFPQYAFFEPGLWLPAPVNSSRCLWRATHMQRDAMTPLGVRLAAFGGEEGSVDTLMRCARQ